MTIRTTVTGSGIAIVAPEGYLTDMLGKETEARLNELGTQLQWLIKGGTTKIIVDCSKVEHINSVGLGVLITAHSGLCRIGGRLVFAAVNARVKHIFEMTKLTTIFEFYDTVEEAAEALSKPGQAT